MSKQALAHACSIGPEGILASSFMLFYDPQQNANWDGNVSQNDEGGDSAGSSLEEQSVTLMRQTDGLKHAPKAVAKMKAEQNNGENVPDRYPPDLKPRYQIMVDIPLDELRFRMDISSCELQ